MFYCKCKENCDLKNVSKNCAGQCERPFGHSGEHICAVIHKCKEKCELSQKARGCKIECCLSYDHKTPHSCNEKHYCNNKCYYEDKSRSCNDEGKCILIYNHKGKCTCGINNHLCSKKCSKGECQNLCNLLSEHEEELHDCKEFHICNKICSLKKYSKYDSCEHTCRYEYGNKCECFCKIPNENHK